MDAGVLGSLAEAIAARELVAFDYHGGTRTSRRRVEPHRQVLLHLRWYLLAWDVAKEDWRIFRVDRMADVVRTGSHHSPRPLPAASAVDYLRQGLNAERQRVEIIANTGVPQVADAVKYQDAEIAPLTDGRTRITLWLDSWEWLLQGLAFLDADFTIVEPPEFRAAYANFARRLLTGSEGAGN